jgi:AcrR family transcriptional regulator
VTAVRREGDRELPLGPKATRTREAILASAARLFADQGYSRTSVADVAAFADVSLGTVYQYFRDRADLVGALMNRGVATTLERTDSAWRAAEGYDGVHRVLLDFVRAYAASAELFGVWEEVTHLDEDLAALRRELGRIFTGTVERELKRARRAKLVRPDLDPALAARALTGMADRYCYVTYVFDPPSSLPTPEQSADVLAKLWSAAIAPTPIA